MNMRKTQFVFAALAAASGAAIGMAGTKTVNVKRPGTLEKHVKAVDAARLASLKIKGTLNNDDVRHLRLLLGSDSLLNQLPSSLRSLDLADVSFENSGSPFYARGGKNKYSISSAHSLPACLTYQSGLEEIVLPQKLDTVCAFSLSQAGFRNLSIPDGVYVDRRAVVGDTLLQTLRLPAMPEAVSPSWAGLKGLKSISYGDVDYCEAQSFTGLPELEEIVFEGMVGHIDGYNIKDCPKLRRVEFRGPVNTTGGAEFTANCPELEEISIDGLVLYFGNVKNEGAPKFKGYRIGGAVIESGDTALVPVVAAEAALARPELARQLEKLARWEIKQLRAEDSGFLRKTAYSAATELTDSLLDMAGMPALADSVREAVAFAKSTDDFKPKLQILKESPSYQAGNAPDAVFVYAMPSDSVLAADRAFFNLDSIAGEGTDVEKMKRLTYWVHDLVPHDGGSYNPEPRNLRHLAEVCKEEGRGVNCRMMAIMLTEALLAEGIPARYLTCQPKAWDTDSDCHVICVGWSESLGKWIWLDPTFAAFVSDENGTPLHPGEVRDRLRRDMPLVLNEDANWNHKSRQTKERYLDNYMAKNLYFISANSINQAEPESSVSYPHKQGKEICLSPLGARAPKGTVITTDEVWFWQRP